jgi:hypothetical protein
MLTMLAMVLMGMMPARVVTVESDEPIEVFDSDHEMDGPEHAPEAEGPSYDYEQMEGESNATCMPACILRARERPVLTSRFMANKSYGESVMLVYIWSKGKARYVLRPLIVPPGEQMTRFYAFHWSGTYDKFKLSASSDNLAELECAEELHGYLQHESETDAEVMSFAGKKNARRVIAESDSLLDVFVKQEFDNHARQMADLKREQEAREWNEERQQMKKER